MTPFRKIELQRIFIAALALAITAVFAWMIRSYLAALFLAAVIALFLSGPHRWLTAKLGKRRKLAAGLLVTASVLAFIIPASLLLGVVVDQAVDVTQMVTPWVQEQVAQVREGGLYALPEWMPFRDTIIQYQATVTAQIGNLAGTVGRILVNSLRAGTGGFLVATLNLFILIYALYYFLTMGQEAGRQALSLLPMTPEARDLLLQRAISTIRATVKGSFLIALVQGTLTGLGLYVAGAPGSIFWAAVTALLSIIPMVGPPLVWIPASIWLLATGNPVAGIALALWGTLVVGTLDNILRPILVGQDAKMSDLMVLISTLGGLTLFGAVGIILGPVIAALFTSVWFIFRETYAGLLEEDAEDDDAEDTTGEA